MGLIKDFIFDRVEKGLRNAMHDVERDMTYKLMARVNSFKRKVVKELIVMTILATSLIFLAVAILFLLIDYAGLNRTLSFAIIGVVMLIVALLIKLIR